MFTLHVYMTARPGKEAALGTGIRDSWISTMSEQPGFLHAALLMPFAGEALDAIGGFKPTHTFEIVSFWESEQKRLEWVARPIHNQVFEPLLELTVDVRHTLATVEHSREL
jgi:heme-degrading monooxygenase HmoA